MRRAPRTDANQSDIATVLRQAGCTVLDLSRVGGGCPDLCVGGIDRRTGDRRTWLIEIKTAAGNLNPRQQEWHAEWRGQIAVVRTVDEALRVIGAIE